MAVAGVGPAGRGHGRAPLCRRLHGLGQRRSGRLQGGHWSATAVFATAAQLTISRPTDTTQETIQETEENELDILCKILEDAGYTVTLNECYLQAK
jgi:hypothetical protein